MRLGGTTDLRLIQIFDKGESRRAQESRCNCNRDTTREKPFVNGSWRFGSFCSPPDRNPMTGASPAKAPCTDSYRTGSRPRTRRARGDWRVFERVKCTRSYRVCKRIGPTQKQRSSRHCHCCFEWERQAGNTANHGLSLRMRRVTWLLANPRLKSDFNRGGGVNVRFLK